MTYGLRGRNACAGISAIVGLLSAGTAAAAGQSNPPLALETTIPLKDVSGRIDHLAFDAANQGNAVPGYKFDLLVLDDGTATAGQYDPAQAATSTSKSNL